MLHKSLEISYFDNMGNNILRTGQQDLMLSSHETVTEI